MRHRGSKNCVRGSSVRPRASWATRPPRCGGPKASSKISATSSIAKSLKQREISPRIATEMGRVLPGKARVGPKTMRASGNRRARIRGVVTERLRMSRGEHRIQTQTAGKIRGLGVRVEVSRAANSGAKSDKLINAQVKVRGETNRASKKAKADNRGRKKVVDQASKRVKAHSKEGHPKLRGDCAGQPGRK